MKKLILGIIAVFLIEIGFITYSQLSTPADPTVAAVESDIGAPERDLRDPYEPDAAALSVDSASASTRGPDSHRARSNAAKPAPSVRRTARRIRPRTILNHALSARAVLHRPRVRVAPRPGYHTEVQREYFGRMVVEVTYRVYDFRPRNASRIKKGQYIA